MQRSARLRSLLLAAGTLAAAQAPSLAQAPEIAVTLIPGSPASISAAECPPGDNTRMFVLTRTGQIRVLNLSTNAFASTPFAQVAGDSSSNGLTGLAFHPQFLTNGYFYVWTGLKVVRLRALGDPASATLADPASLANVIRIYTSGGGQHTGGWIGFGPDGMLWISTGDGGSSANGQRTDNLSGRILRIDVDGADNIPGNADDDAFPDDAAKNYSIPQDNPFVNVAGVLPEIWANGLRNPYRCSFDAATGDFWIADVGGGSREEINFQPAHVLGTMPGTAGYTGGRNYGWAIIEGTRCIGGAAACAALTSTPPIAEYPHVAPTLPPLNIATGTVVIGGTVYHGCLMPQLRGWYFFGDAGSVGGAADFIWALRQQNGVAIEARQLLQVSPTAVYGFAQDHTGELYLCGAGGLYRIRPADLTGRDLNNDGILDSCQSGCGADVDATGVLDPDDLSTFITAFFAIPPEPLADFDHSGAVDPDDLSTYISVYFACTN